VYFDSGIPNFRFGHAKFRGLPGLKYIQSMLVFAVAVASLIGCTRPFFTTALPAGSQPVSTVPTPDPNTEPPSTDAAGESEPTDILPASDTDAKSRNASVSPVQSAGVPPQESALDADDAAGNTTMDSQVMPKSMQSVIDEALDYCQASQVFWQKGELEKALEALDQAYALLLTVDISSSQELIQQKEDLRFMISKRILEIYASRNIVINGNHKAIPIVLNKHVLKEIEHFTGNEKPFFTRSYKRSGKYRPLMVAALKEAGLPIELSWLPLIESGFLTTALSSARALGLWQFIPSTGYKFGLKRDQYIDERLDPVKSTRAAVDYLKELHQIFGDWSTALAAYNCGEGRVLRLIKSQNINYLDNFWDLYERLPSETSRYVPRYLASLHMINHPKRYGLDVIEINDAIEYETVSVTRQVHLKHVASALGISESHLKELNPELRYGILPNEAYPLRIPPKKEQLLMASLDSIPLSYPPQRAYIKHKIRPGESLSTIAERYRTGVSRIVRANNIRRRNYIVAGTILKIPTGRMVIRQAGGPPAPADGKPFTYTVKSGDSLWILAKRYRTTTKKIVALNSLPNSTLHIGQKLTIPGREKRATASNGFREIKVKPGESPFRIAQRHNMSLERFLSINNLSPRSKIYPGQTLYVE